MFHSETGSREPMVPARKRDTGVTGYRDTVRWKVCVGSPGVVMPDDEVRARVGNRNRHEVVVVDDLADFKRR